MKLSNNRGIPTPAAGNGLVLVGGGFGSYDLYGLDARSGRLAWHQRPHDDGPTAAALSDGFAAINTESYTLEVVAPGIGQVVWENWLGDPLLAQPGIAGDGIFMAYPRDGWQRYPRKMSWQGAHKVLHQIVASRRL